MGKNIDNNKLQNDIDLLLETGWKIDRIDINGAFRLGIKAEKLSRMHNYLKGISMSLIFLARIFSIKGEYTKAFELVNEGNEMAISLRYIKGQIKGNYVLGYLYNQLGNLESALSYYLNGLKLMKEYDQKIEPGFLNNIGAIYANSNRIEEAIECFKEGLNTNKENENNMESILLSNLADCYLKQNNIELALETNKRALELLKEANGSEFHLAHCYGICGLIYKEKKEWDKALEKFQESLSLFRKNNYKYMEIVQILEIGKLYVAEKKNLEAIDWLNKGMEIAIKIKADELQKDSCMLLTEIYEAEEDYKTSLKYLKRYIALNEKIKTKELNEKLDKHMVELKVEKAQKDAEIQRLKNEELKRKTEEAALRAAAFEESYKNIEIIGEIGQTITATLNIETVLNLVYENIHKLMEADLFGICLYNEGEKRIDFKILIEKCKPLPLYQIMIENEKSFAAQCIRTKKEIIINNLIADDKIFYLNGGRENVWPKAIIYYPLLIEDKVIGAMTVQSYRPYAYNERTMEIIKTLASYIAIALNNSQKSEELKAKTSELEYLSQTDMLTGLYNRRYIMGKIEEEYCIWQQHQRVFSIVMMDLDNFKNINDLYGHDCGDYILVAVTKVLKKLVRKEDVLARWGGEEFIMLFPNTKGEEAVSLCEYFRKSIEKSEFIYKGKKILVTITLGIEDSDENLGVDSIIINADKALYEGKSRGRNCVVLR